MDVWIIETGEYEQAYVFGVADSLEAAVAYIKHTYAEPYIVEWGSVDSDHEDSGVWYLAGKFQAVQGYSTTHTGYFRIERQTVRTMTGIASPEDIP